MLFSNITLLDENLVCREHQWVGIADSHIHYISDQAPSSEEAQQYGEVYEGEGKLLMSALYNTHAHAPMTLLRGYAESMPLQSWLNDAVFPFEAKITEEDIYWATLLACAEMARFGVASFSDMYYNSAARIRAVAECGMKMNVCDTLVAFEEKPFQDYPLYATNEQLISEHHQSEEGRILVDLGIHAEYTTNPTSVSGVIEQAKEKGLRLHVHVSESKSEHEECKKRRNGLTPVQYFDSLGMFECPTTAAHCVWVEEADIDILAEKKVFVANNPVSNMKLGSGFAPISRMLERGIAVTLGTDGVASNNNHDMLQDLYVMSLIYKGAMHNPALVTPEQVLAAATRTGAVSQGRQDCGVLKVGAKADLMVLDTSGPSWTPMTNAVYNLVFAGHGSDVCLTMVDGAVVYREGTWPTLDIERAKAETSAATRRIISSL